MPFIEHLNDLILIASLVMLVSVATSVLAFRYGAPLLLVFLGIGLLVSANGIGFVHFSNPDAAFAIGSIAVAFILFESGLESNLADYRLAAWPAAVLATLGVVLTALIVGVFCHTLLNLPWGVALLLGAIVSPTDTAAASVMLRVGGIHIRNRVRSTLEIESALNDPISIILTLTLLAGLTRAGVHAADATPVNLPFLAMGADFVMQCSGGLLFGWAGGRTLVYVLNRIKIDSGLYPVLTLTSVLTLFAFTSLAGGSGFLAVYVAGLLVGSHRVRSGQNLRRFHNGISWLGQIAMFVTLGLLANPAQFLPLLFPAMTIAAGLMFVARPLAVWVCLIPFRFTPNEKSFIAWTGLRGAVSVLLAILPTLSQQDYASHAFTVTFLVVVFSLLLQGLTVKPLARWLRLIVPEEAGPVERVELDLPLETSGAAGGYELVAYNVHPFSLAGGGEKLPRWARPSLIFRDGHAVSPQEARQIRPNDHVYLFAPASRVALLDRLFASAVRPVAYAASHSDAAAFFGDLIVNPDVPLGELAERYCFPIKDDKRDLRAADLFTREFEGKYDLGDRLRFGEVDLIVRAMSDIKITAIGIALPEIAPGRRRWLRIPPPDEIIASLHRLVRRITRRA